MASLDQLSMRERRLVIGFGVVFAALSVVLVPLRVSAYLQKREQQNDEMRDTIVQVQAARTRLALRRAALGDVAARYVNKAPPLGTLVDDAAKASGLVVAMQSDVPQVPRGKLYTERATKITIQKTHLKELASFLERIETQGYPVAITQFDMAKRIEPDSYTVNMTIAAFDRIEAPAPAASATPGSKR
jgi:hypothetical protein